MQIGDVVNYQNYVAVVCDCLPFTLACHDGTTKIVNASECVLLEKRSNVLESFEESILKGCAK